MRRPLHENANFERRKEDHQSSCSSLRLQARGAWRRYLIRGPEREEYAEGADGVEHAEERLHRYGPLCGAEQQRVNLHAREHAHTHTHTHRVLDVTRTKLTNISSPAGVITAIIISFIIVVDSP